MNNVRQVPHPDRLYIQINDEDEHTLSFAFNDDPSATTGIDPNAFDESTVNRAMDMLANVFKLLHRLQQNNEPIKSLI